MFKLLTFLFLFCSFSASFQFINALTCTRQDQCETVSTNYNYVQCVAGTCFCDTSLGFSGSATVSDKCRCLSPATVQWSDGLPYCYVVESPATILARQTAAANCEIYKQKVRKIYDNLISPIPLEILMGLISTDDLFSTISQMRISGIGEFGSRTGEMEYLYGFSAAATVTTVHHNRFLCDGNDVIVTPNIQFDVPDSVFEHDIYNLTQWSIWTFDPIQKTVISTDATILDVGKVDYPIAAQLPAIQQVCYLLTMPTPQSAGNGIPGAGICPPQLSPGSYYKNLTDCVSFMSSIPFGSFTHANSNTTICRLLHATLAIFDPIEHCPHTSPEGGLKCIDFPFDYYYTTPLNFIKL